MPGSGLPILPNLNGFSVHKKPIFASLVTEFALGNELQVAQQAFPLWEFELTYEILRSKTNNAIPDTYFENLREYEQILAVFLSRQAQYTDFLFNDLSDNSRTNQFIGFGDGTRVQFRALRDFGVGDFILQEPIGEVNQTQPISVFLNGSPTLDFEIDETGEYIILGSAATAKTEITASFSFYYKCRFIEDSNSFEEFLYNRWSSKSLKFRSVKGGPVFFGSQPNPPPPTGQWRVFELPTPPATSFVQLTTGCLARNGLGAVGSVFNASAYLRGAFYDLNNGAASVTPQPLNDSATPAIAWQAFGNSAGSVDYCGMFVDGDSGQFCPVVWSQGVPNQMNSTDVFPEGSQAAAISTDASMCVGFGNTVANAGVQQALYWVAEIDAFPNSFPQLAVGKGSFAVGIADDNDTVYGNDTDAMDQNNAVVWSIGGVTETILDLPVGAGNPLVAYGSADGTIAVGKVVLGTGEVVPCFWTGTTITLLPPFAGSNETFGVARGISSDNSVLCGVSCTSASVRRAVVWRDEVLETLPGLTDEASEAFAISGDGGTVMGMCMRGGQNVPCFWRFFT